MTYQTAPWSWSKGVVCFVFSRYAKTEKRKHVTHGFMWTHVCVRTLGYLWFIYWCVAFSAPSHYQNNTDFKQTRPIEMFWWCFECFSSRFPSQKSISKCCLLYFAHGLTKLVRNVAIKHNHELLASYCIDSWNIVFRENKVLICIFIQYIW